MPLTKERIYLDLDDRLDSLAAGIVERIGIDPPELKTKLRPPQLRVVKGAPVVNSFCFTNRDNGTKTISMGANLYPFFHHYTRAAASYFLSDKPNGPHPSSFWPEARSAVASTLDWLSSPATAPIYPKFELSSKQTQAARAFGDFAYRFALCHEIAHVALNHVGQGSTAFKSLGNNKISVFRASQQQELEADQFALELQINSLPDNSQFVTALSSSVYFVHITALLDARLMLLAYLVDYLAWKIELTHPPALARVLNLMQAAESLSGNGSGLQTVHEDLASLDGLLLGAANQQQEKIASATRRMVKDEFARRAKILAKKTEVDHGLDKVNTLGGIPSKVTIKLQRLFNQSPLGVLRALELNSLETSEGIDHGDRYRMAHVMDELASLLPQAFQDFRGLTKAERAKQEA
jgi:uncharacterized protein DUF955